MRSHNTYRRNVFSYLILLVLIGLGACEQVSKPAPKTSAPAPKVKGGYCDKTSYYPGDSANIFLNATDTGLTKMWISDIDGTVVDEHQIFVTVQDTPSHTAYVDGFSYRSTLLYKIPDLASGLYLINGKVPVVIKSRKAAPITVVYPSNTIHAYSTAGGKSFYTSTYPEEEKARIISFARPVPLGDKFAELPFYRWLKKQRYPVSYVCDKDLDDFKSIESTKVLVIPGHNEYWTRTARLNFDRLIDNGGHAAILSGNTMWWQVRYDDTNNTMICYKGFKDPGGTTETKTVHWPEPSLGYPTIASIGADFSLGGYGTGEDKGWDGYKILLPESPILAGTNLNKDDILSCPTAEWDGAPIKGFTSDSVPILDTNKLGFHRINLLAFDHGQRFGPTVGTFIAFQKSTESGIVINTASTNWCSNTNFSDSSVVIPTITKNILEKLLNDQNVFAN